MLNPPTGVLVRWLRSYTTHKSGDRGHREKAKYERTQIASRRGKIHRALALLENPQLVRSEIDRRIAAANDTASNDRRPEALRAESSRNQTRMRRLLDAYQEGLVPLEELRERNAPMQTRQRAVLSELDALRTAKLDRQSQLALATTVERFLTRMREAAGSLSIVERQRVVRLLVREVRQGLRDDPSHHPADRPAPTGSQTARGVPAAAATHRGGLLVPRCGQIVEQDVEPRVEQRLPALPQNEKNARLWTSSLSRQRYSVWSPTTSAGRPSRSAMALCSYQCRCSRHSLPGSINW